MLEDLLIFTRGGLILWALSGGGGGKGSPVDALIRTCLLEERSAGDGPGFSQDGKRALKWAFHNGLGLVFVAVYRRVLRLLYVDDLHAAVRAEFARVYHPKRTTYDGFGDVFQQLHLEAQARAEEMSRPNKQKAVDAAPPRRPRPQPAVHNARGDSESDGNGDGDGSKQDASDGISEENEESGADAKPKDGPAFDLSFFSNLRTRFIHRNKNNTNTNKPTNNKDVNKRKNRRDWNNNINGHSDMKLDFSDLADESKRADNARVNQGQSKIDLAETVEDGPRTKGWFSSVFQSIAGGNSVIKRPDLQPALKALKDRLMTKNVAEEIAEKLCESVAASLEGKKQGSFTSTASTVQAAMEATLVRILTPKPVHRRTERRARGQGQWGGRT
jgi:signal recognition particle receptor subunit alpha